MISISKLGEIVELSRSTLLYYEKIGLIHGERFQNGYRNYSEGDVQRVKFIKILHGGGFSLKECKNILDLKIDPKILENKSYELKKRN